MAKVRKKYSYAFYIGFSTTEILDYLYNELPVFKNKEDLLEFGVNLLTDIPTIQEYKMISSNLEIEKAYSSKTMKKLLKDYFFKADDVLDGTIDSIDILDSFLENCIIIRENTIDGTCKIVTETSICDTYDDIVSQFITESFTSQSESGEININTELFFENVKKCMTKFDNATITTNYGDEIKANLINNELVLFDGNKRLNNKFNKHLVSKILQGMSSIIKVDTTSNYQDNVIKELYCFTMMEDNEVIHVNAEDLRVRVDEIFKKYGEEEYKDSFENELGNQEYTIYCDIYGNKTARILDNIY